MAVTEQNRLPSFGASLAEDDCRTMGGLKQSGGLQTVRSSSKQPLQAKKGRVKAAPLQA